MLWDKIADLNYKVSRSESPTAMADSFMLLTLGFMVGVFEIILYPIWRPIYWLIRRKG